MGAWAGDTEIATTGTIIAVLNDPACPMIRFSTKQEGNILSLVAARDGLYYSRGAGNASLGAVLDSLADLFFQGCSIRAILSRVLADRARFAEAAMQEEELYGIME